MKYIPGFLLLFFSLLSLNAQTTIADYQRADSISQFSKLLLHEVLELNWIDSTNMFWYKSRISPDYIKF